MSAGYKLSAGAAAAEERYRSAPQASTTNSSSIISGNGEMFEWFGGGGGRAAGVNVTAETAMRMAAVWRCVTLIAGAMMCSPLAVFERQANGGAKRLDDHPVTALLADEPNDEMSAPEMVELCTMHVLTRGNGYGLIRQARNGVLTDIDFYHPADVQPYYSGTSVWYRFTNIEDGSQEDHHESYVRRARS